MEEEKKEEKKQTKTGFFKRVWYSITKIEKYPDNRKRTDNNITHLVNLIRPCKKVSGTEGELYPGYEIKFLNIRVLLY